MGNYAHKPIAKDADYGDFVRQVNQSLELIVKSINENKSELDSIKKSLSNSISIPNSIIGTAKQVIVTDSGGNTVTLSTPQDIDVDSNVQFNDITGESLTSVGDLTLESNGTMFLNTGDDLIQADSQIHGTSMTLTGAITALGVTYPVDGDPGQVLSTDGDGNATFANLPTSIQTANWVATANSQTPPPAIGRVMWNNITQVSSTFIYISYETSTSLDVENFIKSLQVADRFVINVFGDFTSSQEWEITSNADNTTYATLGVTFIEGIGQFSQNANIELHFLTQSSGTLTVPGGVAGDVQFKSGNSFAGGGPSWLSSVLKVPGVLTVDDKIGIGIAPVNLIHIKSPTNVNVEFLKFIDSDSTTMMDVSADSSGNNRLHLGDTLGNLDVKLNTAGDSYFNGGQVGIGTTSPGVLLELATSAASTESRLSTYSNDASGSHVLFRKSRSTTIGTLTETMDDDKLGGSRFFGVDTTSNQEVAAEINVFQDGSSGTRVPGRIEFKTATSTASGVVRVTIKNDGKVGIGLTNPESILDIDGAIGIKDGVSTPTTITGRAYLYVDSGDGDLKIKFGDGTIKTIVVDT